MTTTEDGNLPDLEDHLQNLRRVQLYMMRMDMKHPVDSPMGYLAPHIREHILWLETQEKNGVLFLSGANAAGNEWTAAAPPSSGHRPWKRRWPSPTQNHSTAKASA